MQDNYTSARRTQYSSYSISRAWLFCLLPHLLVYTSVRQLCSLAVSVCHDVQTSTCADSYGLAHVTGEEYTGTG